MKRTTKRHLLLVAMLVVLAGVGCVSLPPGGSVSEDCPLTSRELTHLLQTSRLLGNRLWTNDYYVAEWPEHEDPTWAWTAPEKFSRDFSTARWHADGLLNQDAYWREQVIIIFSSTKTNVGEFCHFSFLCDRSQAATWIQNRLYLHPNIPFRQDNQPLHTTLQQACQRVTSYASLFGVSNIWDETQFTLLYPASFGAGEWRFFFNAVRNGFPTPYGISIWMADLPDLPLAMWENDVDKIPEHLPAPILLTAEKATVHAREYLKEYCTQRRLPSNAAFVTNSVQYVVSKIHLSKKNECRLAWVNTFQIPQHEKARLHNSLPIEICTCGAPKSRHIADYHTIVITLDAETGTCLGGNDWD